MKCSKKVRMTTAQVSKVTVVSQQPAFIVWYSNNFVIQTFQISKFRLRIKFCIIKNQIIKKHVHMHNMLNYSSCLRCIILDHYKCVSLHLSPNTGNFLNITHKDTLGIDKSLAVFYLAILREAQGTDLKDVCTESSSSGAVFGSVEFNQCRPSDKCTYGCITCQWHIVKHSDELFVFTFDFSSMFSKKAWGSDAASPDPTHSTPTVLMTLPYILALILPSSTSNPSPLSECSHSFPMPG